MTASLNLSPDSVAAIWNKKGLGLRKQGRLAESIECYEKAIEADPQCGPAWSNKARALDELNKLDQALKCYTQALKLNPNSSSTWNNMGYAYRKLKKYKEAIECYDRAIKLKPNYDKPWFNKGYALEQQGRYKEALECFNRALELQPDNDKYRKSRDVVLETLKNLGAKPRSTSPTLPATPSSSTTSSISSQAATIDIQSDTRLSPSSSETSSPTSLSHQPSDEYDELEGFGGNGRIVHTHDSDDEDVGLASEPPRTFESMPTNFDSNLMSSSDAYITATSSTFDSDRPFAAAKPDTTIYYEGRTAFVGIPTPQPLTDQTSAHTNIRSSYDNTAWSSRGWEYDDSPPASPRPLSSHMQLLDNRQSGPPSPAPHLHHSKISGLSTEPNIVHPQPVHSQPLVLDQQLQSEILQLKQLVAEQGERIAQLYAARKRDRLEIKRLKIAHRRDQAAHQRDRAEIAQLRRQIAALTVSKEKSSKSE